MAKQAIGLGTTADDGTGDTLRAGGTKIKENFDELYDLLGDGTDLSSGISATASVITLTAPSIGGVVAGTQTSATITTLTSTTVNSGTLSLAAGSITDSSGAISFVNENLTTTGTFSAGTVTSTGNVAIADGGTIGTDTDADAITIAAAGAVTFSQNVVANGTLTGSALKDEDTMSSKSDTHVASQQSIKAYVDANTDLVNDTTPQLGGFLDANSKFISHSQGAAIASVAGDTNIWVNFDGNTVHITGTNAITDFGTPKSAGDSMWVIFDAAASVVDSATITVAGNTNYQAAANDLALVYALTTSTFLFMPFPNSGASPVAAAGGGGWLGESGSPLGTSADIIRVNEQTLNNSVTVAATDNGSCTGPLTIASGVTLTITSGGTLTLI